MKGLLSEAAAFVATFVRSTALAPALVTNVVLLIFCCVAGPFLPVILQYIVVCLFVAAILVTLFQCVYFTIKDPDRLSRQVQVLQKYAIDRLLGDERHQLGTTAAHIIAIVNPKNPITEADTIALPNNTEKQSLVVKPGDEPTLLQ